MRHAETVTFGGSGLDRAAAERGSAGLVDEPGARTLIMWRGKAMVTGMHDATPDRTPAGPVALLALDHLITQDANASPLFLGRDETGPLFATDISDWVPEGSNLDALNAFLDPTLQHHPAVPDDHLFAELRAVMTTLTPREAELTATARAVFGWHRSHRFCAACGAQSVMAMSGWQRDCPACGTHHFPRTDPVVIMLITHGDSVLMGRSPGWPEGMYSLLAGFVEPGETMEAAVRREVFEEAGITVGAVRYLASQPWPFPASLMFGCAGVALDTDITVDPAELDDAIWVNRADMETVFAGQHPVIKPARKGAIAHFLLHNWLVDALD